MRRPRSGSVVRCHPYRCDLKHMGAEFVSIGWEAPGPHRSDAWSSMSGDDPVDTVPLCRNRYVLKGILFGTLLSPVICCVPFYGL